MAIADPTEPTPMMPIFMALPSVAEHVCGPADAQQSCPGVGYINASDGRSRRPLMHLSRRTLLAATAGLAAGLTSTQAVAQASGRKTCA